MTLCLLLEFLRFGTINGLQLGDHVDRAIAALGKPCNWAGKSKGGAMFDARVLIFPYLEVFLRAGNVNAMTVALSDDVKELKRTPLLHPQMSIDSFVEFLIENHVTFAQLPSNPCLLGACLRTSGQVIIYARPFITSPVFTEEGEGAKGLGPAYIDTMVLSDTTLPGFDEIETLDWSKHSL